MPHLEATAHGVPLRLRENYPIPSVGIMGLGDEILASGQAQRIYERDPSRRVAICECDGRVRWHAVWDGNPVLARPEDVASGEQVNFLRNARGCRPYLQYPFAASGALRFSDWQARNNVGRIFLTEAERKIGLTLRGAIGDYVLIEPSQSSYSNPNKAWPFDRFVELVASSPHVQFVQTLHETSRPLPGVCIIGTSSFREACGVLQSAVAFVGTEGGLHHAAAALDVRAVVIFGGYVSPRTTGYATHVNLADDGADSPCGQYHPCEHCRSAMERISVTEVKLALSTFAREASANDNLPAPASVSAQASVSKHESLDLTA